MDYNIYIVLPENKLHKINIVEEYAFWSGEKISYIPRRFKFNNKLSLVSADAPFKNDRYIKKIKDSIVLRLVDGTNELERLLNLSSDIECNDIIELLYETLKIDKYCIYIFEDDNLISEYIKFDSSCNLIKILENTFSWDNPSNVLIYHL